MGGAKTGWSLNPFSSLEKTDQEELREVINRANRVRPRLFPGDRIRPETLSELYADCEVVRRFEDGICVGCLFLRIQDSVVWLLLLAVLPEHQGKDLGTAFLNQAASFARVKGKGRLILQAVGERLANYYVRNGFDIDLQETMPVGKWGSPEPFELWTLSKPIDPAL